MSKRSVALETVVGVCAGVAVLFALGRVGVRPLLSATRASVADKTVGAILVTNRIEWNFGDIRSGTVGEAAFEIRNTGNGRLILRKTNGDCDCISTGEAELTVDPGGHRTIVATLKTNDARGVIKTGVHYQTNDPRRPRLSLFCLANVVSQ